MGNKTVNLDEKRQEKKKNELNGFIKKIKIDKKTDIPEIYYTKTDEKHEKTVILKGQAKPLDSFLKALQSLSVVFSEICEMEDKVEETTITTVNFSQKGGVIISAQVELENGCPQPLCINTPLVSISDSSNYCLPEYAQKQIEELKTQAIMYMNGEVKEKQTTLPLKA